MKLDFGLSEGNIDSKAQAAWSHKFGLTYSITLGTGELSTSLAVSNTESSSWEFQVLFHTYLKIDVSINMFSPAKATLAVGLPVLTIVTGYLQRLRYRP